MGGTLSVQSQSLPPFPEDARETFMDAAQPGEYDSPANRINALFQRYSRLVLSVARRILADKCEAEEVVQEVFLYAYLKAHLFNPARGSEKTWITQITLSRALDRKSYLTKHGFYAGGNDCSIEELLAKTDLETEISAKLNRLYLERAFADLSPQQRRTIQFFYFEGLELREISEQLSEPLGNIRHHLYRGLKRLRESGQLLALR